MPPSKPAPPPDAPKTDLRLPSAATAVLLFSWWLGMGWYYYHQPALTLRWDLALTLVPNPFAMRAGALWDLIKLLAELGWLLALGAGLGEMILGRLRLPPRGRLLRSILDVSIGWGALGLAMAVLGFLKLWRPGLVFGVLAALTLPAILALRRMPSEPAPEGGPWAPLDAALLAALAAFLGLNLLGAMMPEIFYDALSCHLILPDLFWRHHGFYPVLENAFSGVPLLVQMLFAIAAPVGGERLAHLMHLSFGVLCALAAFDFGRRCGGRRTGLLAALLFYANPLVGVISWKATVDLGTTLYQFLALYAAALAFEDAEPREVELALAGVFTGLAMGTKYQAWPLAGIMTVVVAWKLRPLGPAKAAKALATFAVSTAAVAAIWPLRDLILYGNPLYPFYQERFTPAAVYVDWRAMLQDGGQNWKALLGSWAGLKRLLTTPWSLSIQQLDTRSFGPVFLLGLPLLFAVRFRSRAERVVLACTLALWAAWSLTNWVPRYFLPTFLPAAILFASALERGLSGNTKKAGYLLALYVSVVNFFWTAAWLKTYEADGVIFGSEKAADYLARAHPSYGYPYHACAVFVNASLPADARVMTLGEERGHYIERDVIATTVFAEHPLARALRAAANPEDLRAALARDGVTHLLVNDAKLRELGLAHWLKLDARESAVLDAFNARYTRGLFAYPPAPAAPECEVFAIAP
ncbi:MAG: glycosyltransferase family 39 protein [Elusimicrobiota bacterium]